MSFSASPIELNADQRAVIEQKIATFLAGTHFEEAQTAVATSQGLPLYLDWGGCFLLRPDGVMLLIRYDQPNDVRVVEDDRLCHLILACGGLADPELGFLVPPRPGNAIRCRDCRGTGKYHPPKGREYMARLVNCPCGGLGWVHKKEDMNKPCLIGGVAGAAMGFAIAGAFAWDLRFSVAGAALGALLIGALGGKLLSTNRWAMIGVATKDCKTIAPFSTTGVWDRSLDG